MPQATDPGATVREDEDSYKTPYRHVLAKAKEAWRRAGLTVKGAEQRTRAAQLALRNLKAFNDEVTRRLAAKTFHELPRFKDRGKPIGELHMLTVGPYRGVFLVRPDGTDVIALVFSEAPHEMGARIAEVANRYPPPGVSGSP